jgi:Zn-dependent peptidase ImmA (M78 family)
MAPDRLLEQAARGFGAAKSVAELRRAVDLWAPRFYDSLPKRVRDVAYPDLGMDVRMTAGRGGWMIRKGDDFVVGIGERGNQEHRFTLAHELAHVVLDLAQVDGLGEEIEEDLCDLFARRALIPPAMARDYFDEAGPPRNVPDLRHFAEQFSASLRLCVVALNDLLPPRWPVGFLAASWRQHARGDGVWGLRVEVSACDRRIFFPKESRLSTLGYENLEAWATEAVPGALEKGRDECASPKSRARGVTEWRGESRWQAERHLGPGTSAESKVPAVLAAVDLSGLRPISSMPRRRRMAGTQERPPAVLPGQMGLIR